ncbi:MAG TPA: DUF1801 domain-containing protein [Patescibacteria group bacterium]|nr:DUF1801 domain-containing protein [Patescibacteria group bacterium]
MKKCVTIDEYIADFPKEVQSLLQKMRATIHKAAPQAIEAISYGIPTFKLNGKNLVHFGGFKDHVSFFPTGEGVSAFAKELSVYKVSKGTIQFPLDSTLPYELIGKITKHRVKEVHI